MQVRHDEGVAIRIDPEPCAVVRKGDSEASVGKRIGQPLSLAKIHILGADAVAKAEGKMDGRVNASVWPARCRQTVEHSSGSGTMSPTFGGVRSNDEPEGSDDVESDQKAGR